MNTAKKNIINVAVIFILFSSIIVRLFLSDDNNTWINVINFIGIIMAWLNLHFDIYNEYHGYKKFNFFTGISAIVVIIMSVIAVLIFFNIILVTSKFDDIITLLTLLISLPSEFYKKLIGTSIEKGDKI